MWKNGYFCAFKLFGLLQGLLQCWGQNINKQISYCIELHATPSHFFSSIFKYAHLIWHDVTTCYANTVQKHWYHNSCVLERWKKNKTDDSNVGMYKNQNVILYTTKTSSAYYVVHWSGLWQLMGVPEKCFVLIFTTILVTKSSLWCVYEISARVTFGSISTGRIQNDRYKKYMAIHVCAQWTFFPNDICNSTKYFFSSCFWFTCVKKAHNVTE